VGVSRAKDAIDMALNNAVLGKVQLEQATALLVSISGASDLTLQEVIPRIPYDAVSTLISACLRLIWL
jgi:cell division GTPase FtsZ